MKWLKFVLASIGLAILSRGAFAADVGTAAELAAAIAADPSGTYTLTADIDCSGWTTIDGFSGTLDGKGYKITNLDAPLFGTITGDIAISNLVVKGANVVLPSGGNQGMLINSVTATDLIVENVTFMESELRNPRKQGNVGFVVGTFTVTGAASFENCSVDNTCSFGIGVGLHGGIAGKGTATGTDSTISFTHCRMEAALSYAETYGSQFGGLAGSLAVNGSGGSSSQYAHLVMDGCTNRTSTVVGNQSNHGFAGLVYAAQSGTSGSMGDAVISRCANYGSCTSTGGFTTGTNFGGLLGGWSNGKLTMEDCVNYGDFSFTQYSGGRPCIGGMVGSVAAPIKVTVSITGCANCGDITGQYAGGMIGTLSHNGSYTATMTYIRSCMNTGALTTLDNTKNPGQAICMLISGVAYPSITVEGGLWTADALIGTYAEGASVTTFNTDDNVYLNASEGLVDGTDLARLNAYGENSNLWKQGYENPILKILPDEAAPDTITVAFKDAEDFGSTVLKSVVISRGGNAFAPEDPVHEGYTFLGWDPAVFSGLMSSTDVVAVYQQGVLSYDVRFFNWDGSQIGETQSVEHGHDAVAPADPTRTGYIFTGWDRAFTNVTEAIDVHATYVASNVYISSAEDFSSLIPAASVAGVTYHLTQDIVLPGNWQPVDFIATLDCGGHTVTHTSGKTLFDKLSGRICNAVIDGYDAGLDSATSVTLANNADFGVVARIVDGGEIADVVLRNYTVRSGENSVVGLVAIVMRNGAVMRRVSVESSCRLQQKHAIVGGLAGKFDRTEDFAPVDGENAAIVGVAVASIFDSTNSAPISTYASGTAAGTVGGIVGAADVANSTYKFTMVVSNCVNTASIFGEDGVSTSVNAGGIVGKRDYNNTGDIGALQVTDCANLGDVSPTGVSGNYGGIVGYTYRGARTVLTRCVNRGNIGGAADPAGNPMTGGNAGGMFGYVSDLYVGNPMQCVDCANYGNVTCGLYAGGIFGSVVANAGHQVSFSAVNSANYGTISVVDAENGLVGQAFARFPAVMTYGACTITVTNCYFLSSHIYGAIAEQTKTGGIVQKIGGNIFLEGSEMTPRSATTALNAGAEAAGYSAMWVLGRVGEGGASFVAPELACFMTKAANPGFTIIIR